MKDIYRALADKNKRKIIYLLSKNDLTVNEILKNFTIKQATLSAHLSYLGKVGLVSVEKISRYRKYQLNKSKLEAFLEEINNLYGHTKMSGDNGNIINTDMVLRR